MTRYEILAQNTFLRSVFFPSGKTYTLIYP
jgi:hypothetical protein